VQIAKIAGVFSLILAAASSPDQLFGPRPSAI